MTHNNKLYLLGGRNKDHSLVQYFEEYNLDVTVKYVPRLDTAMPNDVLLEIFRYFDNDEKTLVFLTRVCKKFNKLASLCFLRCFFVLIA